MPDRSKNDMPIAATRVWYRPAQRKSHAVWAGAMLGLATLLPLLSRAGAWGQATGKGDAPADANTVLDAHAEQLRNCREGILDPQVRPEDRRRWIRTLFSFDTPQAKDLIIELLRSASPGAQEAICEFIADRAHRHPTYLDDALVEPLIDLLGVETDTLRNAASRALADFPDADVPAKLGALASKTDAPMAQRLAAIDAMVSKVDRRDVVRELMGLLEGGGPQIRERVIAALQPVSRVTLGGDLAQWQAWWERKSKLTEEEWLADRLQMYRERHRALADEFATFKQEMKQRHAMMTARVGDMQRELFRGLSNDAKEAKLVEWLSDPLPEVQHNALGLIRARIADEGRRPVDDVLTALLRLLKDGSANIRREVSLILQNLTDPAIVNAVLAQLAVEEDITTRHALFKALGKLNSPAAVPVLVKEIQNDLSHPDCVREAANALGQVAGKLEDANLRTKAVGALKQRYHADAAKEAELRGALLTAMAGVGDAAFAAEFQDALESDIPIVLRPAIRGLRALGDRSRLPRLRTLTADADPLVRRAACEAVGELGLEDADLEPILARLNPAIESDDQVRDAAWRGLQQIAERRSVPEQIQVASRLRDVPEIEIRYLTSLANRLSQSNGSPHAIETVTARLAAVLISQGKHAEAVPYLRRIYEAQRDRSEVGAPATGLQWLDAALHSYAQHDVAKIITELAGAGVSQDAIIETVDAFISTSDIGTAPDGMNLLRNLQTVPAELLGDGWPLLLRTLEDQLAGNTEPDAPSPAP